MPETKSKMFLLTFLFLTLNYLQVDCHGRLRDPPARSSCWREFGSKCKTEYTDNQMFCGGFDTQYSQNGGKCGICGDNYAGPRTFERGGSGYTGFIVKSYNVGQVIDVKVEITTNHYGWFEFRLCNADSLYAAGKDATQECLNKNVLKDINGKTRMSIGSATGWLNYKLVLPAGLSCNRCVLQWRYHNGNNWGTDPVTGQSGMGLGPQEEFYGCSDIKIGTGSINPVTSAPLITTKAPVAIVTVAPTSINKCPNGDGSYADKASGCRKYYMCVHTGTQYFKISEFSCPADLLFDNVSKVCNYANLVKC